MTARCELTELTIDSCAHCRGNTLSPQDEAVTERVALINSGRWFHAVHPGTCAVCGTPFEPGTAIRLEIPRGWRAECCRKDNR